jgi:VWFA-related protein
LLAGACVVGTLAAMPQAPLSAAQSIFRADASIVPLFATVRDPNGHLVTDLDRRSFEVFDDGRPVELAVFSGDIQPVTMTLLVDVSGNFVDPSAYARLRTSLMEALASLAPGDRVRFGTFGGYEIALGAQLTGDLGILRRTVREELWHGYGGRPMWNAVGSALSSLAEEPGRRVVLVLTHGPNSMTFPGRPDLRAVEAQTRDGDVLVYGIVLAATRGIEVTRRDGGSRNDAPEALLDLTRRTGGGYFHAPNGANLTQVLAGVFEELRHQYILGFAPATDGKLHKIDVRVSGPGQVVRSRTEYMATRRDE